MASNGNQLMHGNLEPSCPSCYARKWQIKGELREMTLIDAQNEVYQSLLEEGDTKLAEA